MKKIFWALAASLPLLFISCGDDDNQEDQNPNDGQNQLPDNPQEPEVPKFSDLGTPISGIIDGHAYVDFGSFKMATMNVGALKESDFGDYFAWGDVNPKDSYVGQNSTTYRISFGELESKGVIDRRGVLTSEYDAATQNWGENWKMPSVADIEVMIDECDFTWMVLDSVKGFKVSSKNDPDAWVFLPACGYMYDTLQGDKGNPIDQNWLSREPFCDYWTSNISGTYDMYARKMYCRYDGLVMADKIFAENRYYGLSIRPIVSKKESATVYPISANKDGHDYVDLGLPSGTKWATVNIGAKFPNESGDFYMWGETATSELYTNDNCKTDNNSLSDLIDKGFVDESKNLVKDYDVASVKWGGKWRMPSKAEFDELINNCTWEWIYVGNMGGYKVINKENSKLWIFLPAAGALRNNESYGLADPYANNVSDNGYYWSSSYHNMFDGTSSSYDLVLSQLSYSEWSNKLDLTYESRYYGLCVRPVWVE